jgi:tRNA(adenine34) deaminase
MGTAMTLDRDHHFMGLALAQAQAAAAAGETPVGAVIVDPATDQVIAEAGNAPIGDMDPTGHAEIRALRQAAQRLGNYRLTGLELFVTLGALRHVRRRDQPCPDRAGDLWRVRPKGGAIAHGPRFFEQPTCHWRPDVTAGVRGEEASTMLKDFFRARRGK